MQQIPLHMEHRKRLRDKFARAGSDGLHDYELLELLLTYAIPRQDVKPVAKQLLKRFGTLSKVLDAPLSDLQEVKGLGPNSALLINLVKELFNAYFKEELERRDALNSPQAVVNFATVKLAGLPHEAFMIVYVNVKNEVIGYEIIHEGTVDRAVIYPRRIVEAALKKHASALILVHNHPSGHPDPSQEDRHLTRSIIEATRTIEVRVLDHIIVGKHGYYSFQENRTLNT
jgi:DNA repair protein RadC